ncbi:MAG: hypothetical protein HKN94_02130 [Acidimicrobiales bacterium]|nr:hypothetical protein [Acidimicrobiales bacterium]
MNDNSPFAEFSDEEFAEYFEGDPVEEHRFRRFRVNTPLRFLGLLVAIAMLAGSLTIIVDQLVNFASLNNGDEIRERGLDRVSESTWGWLASDVQIDSIPEPRIGGFVRNGPPNGVIFVDLRPWNPERLDELIDHELGHLLDYAIWNEGGPGERRGGLDSEAWAECSAVVNGTRRVDTGTVDTEYHCYPDELEIYESVMADIIEVCKTWGVVECR